MTDSPAEKRPCSDCTEPDERDALTELVEREARLRAFVAVTGAVVVCTDEQLRVTEFNPAAERVFGRRAEEVLGHRYSELFPVIVRKKVDRDFERVLRGQTIQLFENVIVDPTGATTVMLWDVKRLVDTDGRPTGVVAVGHDITARQAAAATPLAP